GLNESVDALGIGRCDGDVDLAERRGGQPMALDTLPLRPAIVRDVEATSRATAEFAPGTHLHLPHTRDQRVRIVRIHGEPGAADILAAEENPVPVLAAVGRAVDALLLLRSGRAAQYAGEDDDRVGRMNDDAADPAGLWKSHVGPRMAGIGRPVDAVTHHVTVADCPRLGRPRPH